MRILLASRAGADKHTSALATRTLLHPGFRHLVMHGPPEQPEPPDRLYKASLSQANRNIFQMETSQAHFEPPTKRPVARCLPCAMLNQALPIKIPVINTSSPPSPTCSAAESGGVSM